jgi:hypothetical protein
MAAVRLLHKQGENYDNGCGTDGCNVLQIVGVQINALSDAQESNTRSIQTLITEKFDNIEKNNIKESNRIDELRKGDMEAVRIANDSTVKRAELLSTQLVETAETVRKTTDTLATTVATQFKQITDRQDEKIAALERVNWENSGKAGASPTLQSLVTELIALKSTNDTNAGVAKGQQVTKNSLIVILTIAIAVITVIMSLISFFRV